VHIALCQSFLPFTFCLSFSAFHFLPFIFCLCRGLTSCEVFGRAALSKHSDTCRLSLLASVMDLKKKVCSWTPLIPKVLLMLPTPAITTAFALCFLPLTLVKFHAENMFMICKPHVCHLCMHKTVNFSQQAFPCFVTCAFALRHCQLLLLLMPARTSSTTPAVSLIWLSSC